MRNHNRYPLRRVGAVLMAAAMMLCITACGQGSTFDASGYVDATMKSVTTQDSSALKAYADTAVTDYADSLTKDLEDALSNLSDTKLSADVQKEYKAVMLSMLKAISYSVGEAKESTEGSASGYEVPLTIKPLQLNVKDQLNDWMNKMQTADSSTTDINAIYEKIYKEVASLLKTAVAEGKYGEAKTYTISVTKNDKGLYALDEKDMEKALEGSFTTDLESLG